MSRRTGSAGAPALVAVAVALVATTLCLIPAVASARAPTADLRISGSSSDGVVRVDEEVTFTVTVTNDGPDAASLTNLSAYVGEDLDVTGYSDPCQLIEGYVTCYFDSIPAGQSRSMNFTIVPHALGDIDISTSTGAIEDANTANNNGGVGVSVVAAGGKRLEVTKTGQGTVASDPAGINCGSDCAEIFPADTEDVTLTANPASGQRFDSWSGPCEGVTGRVCTVPMDVDQTVGAKFVAEPTGPPVSKFDVIAATKKLPITTFDASASANASKLEFKITGGDKIGPVSQFQTSAANPFTTLRIKQPGTYTATLTAINPGGTSTSTQKFTVPKTSDLLLDARMPNIGVTSYTKSPFQSAGQQACVLLPKTQLTFGMVDIRGQCMEQVLGVDQLPMPERNVTGEWFDSQLKSTSCGFIQLGNGPCFTKAEWLGVVKTTKPVQINGMTLTPRPGASIVIFPASGRIVSSNAALTVTAGELGTVTAMQGPIDLWVGSGNLTSGGGTYSKTLFSFNAASLPKIGGFSLDGQMTLKIVAKGARRYTEVAASMLLPEAFSTSANTRPSGRIVMEADNDNGLSLGELNLSVPEAFLGGVRFTKLGFTYKSAGEPAASPPCPRKYWKATAEVYLIPSGDQKGLGLSLAPPPERQGIAFCAGEFHSAGGTLTFGDPIPPPQIFPGVFLDSIGFDMQLNPTVFSGTASVTAAKIVRASGGMLAAFPSSRAPYVVQATDGGSTLAPLAGRKLTTTSFALGGSVGMALPNGDTLNMANGYLLYEYPAYIEAAGFARINTFLFLVEASGFGQMNLATRRYNVGVNGNICLAAGIRIKGVGACVGGNVNVSNRGMVGCLIIVDDGFEPGIGYYWGDLTPHIFNGITDGCKPSHYWEQNIRSARLSAERLAHGPPARATSAAARADDSIAFTVEKGDDAKDVELHGKGGAPAVEITAPNGDTVTSVPDEMQVTDDLQVLQWSEYDMTWIGVTGQPGKYVVTPLDGSAPIKEMLETKVEKHDQIKASVTGKGRNLTLSWDVGDVRGRTVTFSEKVDGVNQKIATAKSGKGRVKFEPAIGPAGTRQIVAEEDVDGVPAPEVVVDSYSAPGPTTAPAMKKVRVKRRGTKLLVSWRKGADATGYEIVARTLDGTQKSLTLSKRKSKATIKGIDKTQAGTVAVNALGATGDHGKPKTVKFKYVKKPTDSRFDFKDLGKSFKSPQTG
ncbi:MAG: CARDB domain-containing protein [Solirubrobacterales bacterium]